jgi:hypothetical protein
MKSVITSTCCIVLCKQEIEEASKLPANISFSNFVMTLLYDQSLDILFTLQVLFLYALSQLKMNAEVCIENL